MTARWVAGGGDCLNEESNLQLKHQNHLCLPAPEIVVIELKMIEEWWVLKTNVTVQVLFFEFKTQNSLLYYEHKFFKSLIASTAKKMQEC